MFPRAVSRYTNPDIYPSVVAEDIAEEIVWAASRPAHVNLAEVYVLPVNQASPTIAYRASK